MLLTLIFSPRPGPGWARQALRVPRELACLQARVHAEQRYCYSHELLLLYVLVEGAPLCTPAANPCSRAVKIASDGVRSSEHLVPADKARHQELRSIT